MRTEPRAPPLPAVSKSTLRDKTVLVTGANTGIGLELAREVLASGASLHFTCRTAEKVAATTADLLMGCPSARLRGYALELTDLRSVDALADRLELEGASIDVLILNAGVHVPFADRRTADGHEIHHQVNFLAPARLFLRLCASADPPDRVLYVSSDAHQHGHLPAVFPATFWTHYARSKLLATTFFVAARPLFPSVTISVMSPGGVATDVHRYKHPWVRSIEALVGRARAASAAAHELLQAMLRADDPEAYRNRGAVAPLSDRTRDPALMTRAWNLATQGWDPPAYLGRPAQVLRNHAGTLSLLAPGMLEPESEAALAEIVGAAARAKRKVRVVGSRHSYNDCFYSPSALVSLRAFDEIGELDEEARTITVGAGVTVQALCDHLDARGYALRWAGNSGEQTLVGAATTGTHGYCRDGGLLGELIVAARVVNGEGEILDIDDEADLRALRVSVGTLGVITRATLSIVPAGAPVVYALETLEEEEFLSRLCTDARAHAHYRFFPNRYHPERFSVLTIDPFEGEPTAGTLARVGYIDKTVGPRPLVVALRALLGSSSAHRVLRRMPAPRLNMSLVTRFSTLLFVNAGIVDRWHRLAGLVYQAWNDDRTRNMELAVRPEDFREFLRVFRAVERAYRRRAGDFSTYCTGRYVGGSDRTLIGPNRDRDVVFVDVHVRKGPHAERFMRQLEARVGEAVDVRPHWGKEFAATAAALERAYPAEAWAEFRAAKRRLDPHNAFSNAYTERVFGW